MRERRIITNSSLGSKTYNISTLAKESPFSPPFPPPESTGVPAKPKNPLVGGGMSVELPVPTEKKQRAGVRRRKT